MIFALEMITREPLKIPVFTKKYWATFDDSLQPAAGPRPGPGPGDRPHEPRSR